MILPIIVPYSIIYYGNTNARVLTDYCMNRNFNYMGSNQSYKIKPNRIKLSKPFKYSSLNCLKCLNAAPKYVSSLWILDSDF